MFTENKTKVHAYFTMNSRFVNMRGAVHSRGEGKRAVYL